MSTASKRKTLVETPNQRQKQQRNNLKVTKDEDHQEVSLATGGPLRKSTLHKRATTNTVLTTNWSHQSVSAKLTREQESQWLTSLNRRFEIVQLARQAQDQATVTQLADNKTDSFALKVELQNIAKSYSTVLAQQQSHIDSLSNTNTNQTNQLDDLQKENQALLKQLQSLKDEKKSIEKDYRVMKTQYTTIEQQLETVTERTDSLEEELNRITEENQQLVEQLQDDDDNGKGGKSGKSGKKGSKSESIHKITQLESQVTLLEKQLEVERQHFKTDVNNYKQRIKDADTKKNEIVDQMEKDFQQRLDDALDQQRESHQNELNELADTLGNQNDTANQRLKDQLDNVKAQNDNLHVVKKSLESQITQLNQEIIAIESHTESLEAEKDKLQDQLTEAITNHSNDIEMLEDQLDEMVELYQDKEQLFDELMNVKVSLAIEIDHYRSLLDGEEKRMGLATMGLTAPATPGRRSSRRKADDAGSTPVSTANKKKQDKLSTLVQTGIDMDGKFVKYRNGSTQAIKLEGYSIRSDATGAEFEFPSTVIQPNEQFIAYFVKPTAKEKKQHAADHVFDLSDEDIFNQDDNGDKRGQLFDNLGRSVSKFDFVNKGRVSKQRQ